MLKKYLSELGKYLELHGFIKSLEDLTVENLEEYIKAFQSKIGIPISGYTDAETLWALQYPFVIEKPEYTIKTIDVDVDDNFDCLPNFLVRSDCYERLINTFQEIHDLGGKVFSSGALRSLNASVSSGRSSTSLHYTGIALDLCINAGFTNPDKDPYVIVRERFDSETEVWTNDDIYFRIYCRSEKGTSQKLKAIYWTSHKAGIDLFKEVEDKFICITDIMTKNGFVTIPPRDGFLGEQNRSYLSSEWWHFNDQSNIVQGFSQFGIELIKTFGLEKVKNSTLWINRKAIYNYRGFILADYIDPKNSKTEFSLYTSTA